jgi:DNA-binding FrmR family transcriptional regulator
MSHLTKDELDLVTRTKKIVAQLEAVERALNEHQLCAEILHRLAAARSTA